MRKQVLYRFFNKDNQLLYVGISNNFLGRVGGHRSDKEWFSEITHSTFEYFETREQVDAAETKAIRNEKPLYNKAKQLDYVPVDYHAKQIFTGAIYKTGRFKNTHGWIKAYIDTLRFEAESIKDLRTKRLWLAAKAYELAKADGHWCRSCEGFTTHSKLKTK